MHKKGLLVYNPCDYEKNKWFAHELITKAKMYHLELTLVLREHLLLTIEDGQFKAFSCGPEPSPWADSSLGLEPSPWVNSSLRLEPSPYICSPIEVDFVINRTRDTLIGTHFEKMGCKVFNSSMVTELCNHKGKTHQLVNAVGIPSVKTLLGNIHYFTPSMLPFPYPVVVKAVSGHGGHEVYQINNEMELTDCLSQLSTEDFVLQEFCTNPGVDVRVFILGKQILAAVKRTSSQSFKSNYSLGGRAEAYTLTSDEVCLVQRILDLLDFDLAGIDFIINGQGQFLFNEIEDVVGTRTLYLNYDLDVVALFLKHIAQSLS